MTSARSGDVCDRYQDQLGLNVLKCSYRPYFGRRENCVNLAGWRSKQRKRPARVPLREVLAAEKTCGGGTLTTLNVFACLWQSMTLPLREYSERSFVKLSQRQALLFYNAVLHLARCTSLLREKQMRRFELWVSCLALQFVLVGQLPAALTISIQEVSSFGSTNVRATFSGTVNNQALNWGGSFGTAANGLEGGNDGGTNFRGLFGKQGTYFWFGISGVQPSSPFGTMNQPFDSVNSATVLGFAFVKGTPSVVTPSSTPGNFSSNTVGTWNNTTISGLGLTSGTHTWSWGAGSQNPSSVTIQIGSLGTTIPEPNSLAFTSILGMASIGIGRRRKRTFNRWPAK